MTEIDIVQYLSIPYLYGGRDRSGLDCYGLVLMFFAEHFGISCPDYTYVQDWDAEGFNYIEEEYWKRFEKINSPERYCTVTFRGFGSKIERHIGIMLDDISFLHVPIKGCVCIEKITHRVWARQLGSFYRLKTVNEMMTAVAV